MRPPPELRLPRQRSWTWWALAGSAGLHAILALLFRVHGWLPPLPDRPAEMLVSLPRRVPVAVDMPYVLGRLGPVPPRQSGLRPVVPSTLPVPVPQVRIPDRAPLVLAVDSAPPSAPGLEPEPLVGGLRPAMGDGKLWVAPLPLAPRELAERLSPTHVELVDSAVDAIVQAYIDSVLAMPAPPGAVLPSWTTRIGGQKVGLDSKFIYLGPIKIPTMLLALLNLPQHEVDIRQFRGLEMMREDLARAARRAETLADFKAAVRQLREERTRQREFDRNSRLNPADSTARRPRP